MSNDNTFGFPLPESKVNDPFLNKNIGVALKGPDWLFLIAFLQHTCSDEEAIKCLWEDKEQYEEMVFIIRQLQRQVFLIADKIETGDKGLKDKIVQIKNKIIGLDGKPLT